MNDKTATVIEILQDTYVDLEKKDKIMQNSYVDLEKKDYSSFDNYKKKITLIGYLIGISEEIMKKPPFDQSYLETIREEKDIKIIRALCCLRSNFLIGYDKIYREKKLLDPFAQFDKMDKHIDIPSLQYLRKEGLEPLQYGISLDEFTKTYCQY
jgi:hypothetical protein